MLALYLALNVAYALALSAAEVHSLVGRRRMSCCCPIAAYAADHLYGARVADPLSIAIGLTLVASVASLCFDGPARKLMPWPAPISSQPSPAA